MKDPLPYPPKSVRRIRARIDALMARLPETIGAEDDSHDLRKLDAYWHALDVKRGVPAGQRFGEEAA